MKKIFLLIIITGCFFSCSKRNLVYFSDIDSNSDYQIPLNQSNEPRVQVDDLLSITVTSLNSESNMLFNVGVLMPSGDRNNTVVSNPINENYLVDKAGNINYPVIGLIKLEGLTKQEAINKMNVLLTEYVKDPIINIRFMNFKVTVIGEVQRPNSFVIPTEKITVLEALGLAGDMTAWGKRENVLVLREIDGVRVASRINLNEKNVLNSPYFYLQQNDIVYVEPYKTKSIQADANPQRLAVILAAINLTVIVLFQLRWLSVSN